MSYGSDLADAFRVVGVSTGRILKGAHKDGDHVRLYSRPGNDFTHRFPLIAEALTRLRSRSCIIDGEGRAGVLAVARTTRALAGGRDRSP
jgi:hypothetical protein